MGYEFKWLPHSASARDYDYSEGCANETVQKIDAKISAWKVGEGLPKAYSYEKLKNAVDSIGSQTGKSAQLLRQWLELLERHRASCPHGVLIAGEHECSLTGETLQFAMIFDGKIPEYNQNKISELAISTLTIW